MQVRLEEAHALGVHVRFVAPPAAHAGDGSPELDSMAAVFERAVAALNPAAPNLAAPLAASPNPAGQCSDWAALGAHGSALLGRTCGDATGGAHPNPELHPGHNPARPLSAGALLDQLIGAMPVPLACAGGAGNMAFALPQGAAGTSAPRSAEQGAPLRLADGASPAGSSALESLGSLEPAATAFGHAPRVAHSLGGPLASALGPAGPSTGVPLDAADADLDAGLGSSLDTCTFDKLCHQLILAHGGGGGSSRPGGPGKAAGAERTAAGDVFGDWQSACGDAAGCSAGHGCNGGAHDMLVLAQQEIKHLLLQLPDRRPRHAAHTSGLPTSTMPLEAGPACLGNVGHFLADQA